MCPTPWSEENLFLDTPSEEEQGSFDRLGNSVIRLCDRNWRQWNKSPKFRKKIIFNLKFCTWKIVNQIWDTFRKVRSLAFLHKDPVLACFLLLTQYWGNFPGKRFIWLTTLIQDRGSASGDAFLAGRMLRQHRASYGWKCPSGLSSHKATRIQAWGPLPGPLCDLCALRPHFQQHSQSPLPLPQDGKWGQPELEDTEHFPLENCGEVVPKSGRTT